MFIIYTFLSFIYLFYRLCALRLLLRAVQRTFPEVYESNTATATATVNENCANVKVLAWFWTRPAQFDPQTVATFQYDLASPQKPQSYFVMTCKQRSCVQEWLIRCWRRAFWWMRVERLCGRLLNRWRLNRRIRSGCASWMLSWRFVCGNWDSLDGFTLHPVDLLTIADDAAGLWNRVCGGGWLMRNEGRSVCGACLKGFSGLKRRGKKIFMRTIKRFLATLMPGSRLFSFTPVQGG